LLIKELKKLLFVGLNHRKCNMRKEFTIMIGVTGVVALNGLLYVVGGDDGTSNLASVEVYNPKTDSWSMLPSSMGIGRSYAGVAIIDKPM
jgi:N-acetylneuraminic acid mutarotase